MRSNGEKPLSPCGSLHFFVMPHHSITVRAFPLLGTTQLFLVKLPTKCVRAEYAKKLGYSLPHFYQHGKCRGSEAK